MPFGRLAKPLVQANEGKLVLAGATGHQLDGALLIWKDTPIEVSISMLDV